MKLEGLHEDLNGNLCYYVDYVKNYAGLVEVDGSYYYIASDLKPDIHSPLIQEYTQSVFRTVCAACKKPPFFRASFLAPSSLSLSFGSLWLGKR